MSASIDVRLTDPSEADLLAAIEAVCQRVGIARASQGKWPHLLPSFRRTNEGQHRLSNGSTTWPDLHFALIAWWSDHRGCKHVRLCGANNLDGQPHPHLSRLDEDLRPPLWHVFPDRTYRVGLLEAEPSWLVSCACGVTGRPAEVAWMGLRCGPCHDRREEQDPERTDEPPTRLRQGDPVFDLAFDPSGRTLAVSLANRLLTLLPTDGSPESVCIEQVEGDTDLHAEYQPLVFSPDGQWLAFGDPMAGEPILWPYHNGAVRGSFSEVVVLALGGEHTAPIRDMVFSPKGDHFAACDQHRRGRLFRRVGSASWPEVCSVRGATAMAFSGDGQTLAVGGSGGTVRLLSTDDGAITGRINPHGARSDEAVLFLAWLGAEPALILVTGSEEDYQSVTHPYQLRRWDMRLRRETHQALVPAASMLALSPDGRYLASVYHDDQHGPATIYFRDLVSWSPLGWIEWDPESSVQALAFSPDGENLAIGTETGEIKLMPWRLLLIG